MIPDFPIGNFKPPFTLITGECGNYVMDKANSTVLSTPSLELAEFVVSYGNFVGLHQGWGYKQG